MEFVEGQDTRSHPWAANDQPQHWLSTGNMLDIHRDVGPSPQVSSTSQNATVGDVNAGLSGNALGYSAPPGTRTH